MNTSQPVTVESLMLANHAESVNGLLYISGGGCNIHRRMVSPGGTTPLSRLGLALIIAVPWHRTNLTHDLIIEFRDEDANVIANINSKLNVGRPPGLRPGTSMGKRVANDVGLFKCKTLRKWLRWHRYE